MKQPKENSPTESKTKRYTFAQRQQDDYTCVKLTEGKYKDIIYSYGKVGFKQKPNSEEMGVIFDYTIQRNPKDVDWDNQEFIDYIGDILVEIMEQQLKEGKINVE